MFVIQIADLSIGIENDELKDFFKDYLSDNNPLFIISSSLEDIKYEKDKSLNNLSDIEYLKLSVYRKISEKLPEYNAFLIHGSSLFIKDSKAILLTGKSGAGKSTHASLLRKYYNAEMINDDKPLIRFIDDIPYIYGTPYDGKHHLNSNTSKELNNIVFINQSLNNQINIIDSEKAFSMLFEQVYRPKDVKVLDKTLKLVSKLSTYTNVYVLDCDISKKAAELTYNLLTSK